METAKLEIEHLKIAGGITSLNINHQAGTLPVLILGHSEPAYLETAPFDKPDHPDDDAFARLEINAHTAVHLAFSIISILDLFGGTSGHTFSRGSMRTWHRIAPLVFNSRSIAPGTSLR